jgi:hypothetical protein
MGKLHGRGESKSDVISLPVNVTAESLGTVAWGEALSEA